MVDTKYHNTIYFLYFYCNICYYLKAEVEVEKKLINKKKLFNPYHSNIYYILENFFKVTK